MDNRISEDAALVAEAPYQPTFGLKVFANIISAVFHPILIPTYTTYYLLFIQPYMFAGYDDRMKIFKLAMVFFNTTFLPAFSVFLMKQLGFIESVFLKTPRERIIPYAASMVFYFWTWYVFHAQNNNPELFEKFFLGIFLSVCLSWMLNIRMKVSMHGTAMGVLVCFFVILGFNEADTSGVFLSIAILIAGLVCTSRLILNAHTRPELYIGLFSGIIAQLVAYWY